jgi:hypothetical protein
VDPIQPITPGPSPTSQIARLPLEGLERVPRDRDRLSRDAQQRRRREPPQEPELEPERDPDDGEHPHIDVRA